MIVNIEDLKPLVILDPLLLPLLVRACRIEELPGVISVIPPYLSAALLLRLIDMEKPGLITNKVLVLVTVEICNELCVLCLQILQFTRFFRTFIEVIKNMANV